jgi:hypothetical protein
MRQATTAKVRLDALEAARFGDSAWSTASFIASCARRAAIGRCSRRAKGRSWRRTRRESGECRLKGGRYEYTQNHALGSRG